MRNDSRKKPKIALIEDSQASNDPVAMLTTTLLHKGRDSEPIRSEMYGPNSWAYKGKVFKVEGAEAVSEEEVKLRIKHGAVRHSKEIARIQREVGAFETSMRSRLPGANEYRSP